MKRTFNIMRNKNSRNNSNKNSNKNSRNNSNKDKLVRRLSGAPETRCPLGPVSCRQVQLLRMITPLAKTRKDLSELWRGALSHTILGPPLVQFFHNNMADALHNIIITPWNINDVFSLRQKMLPFVLSRREHVLHYFLILVKGDKYFIYSAYGSDYVRIHPLEIELDMDEFMKFIENANTDKAFRDFFIRKYFLEGGSQQNYIDEGKSRRVYPNIEKGKLLELDQYNEPFQILYYPTLLEQVYAAAKPTLDIIEKRNMRVRRSARLSVKRKSSTSSSKRY
jgi:hypothetical protein